MYQGEWLEGQYHGQGILCNHRARRPFVFKGSFKMGLMEGFGQFVSNHMHHRGPWKNGRINGNGFEIFVEYNETYQGHIKNIDRSGYGQIIQFSEDES